MKSREAKRMVLAEVIEFLHGEGLEGLYRDDDGERLSFEDCQRLDLARNALVVEFERRITRR